MIAAAVVTETVTHLPAPVRWPAKIVEGVRFKRHLAGVPLAANSWPVAAHGQKILEFVTVSRAGRIEEIPCHYLACGFHLIPNIELPMLLGCSIVNGYVQVDEFQETTVPSIFCAGEPTSIGGVESALIEGQIAGLGGRDRVVGDLFRRVRDVVIQLPHRIAVDRVWAGVERSARP